MTTSYSRCPANGGMVTIRICHGVIRQSLEQGRKWGLITRNPAVDASPPRSRHHQIHPPSVEQVLTLLAAAREYDEDFATFLSLLAATGCRRSEALALRWADVDWDKSELMIAHSLDDGERISCREGHEDAQGPSGGSGFRDPRRAWMPQETRRRPGHRRARPS